MNGATTLVIAEILGHKTLQMVKRYAHLADSHTSEIVAKMNDQVFAKLGASGGGLKQLKISASYT